MGKRKTAAMPAKRKDTGVPQGTGQQDFSVTVGFTTDPKTRQELGRVEANERTLLPADAGPRAMTLSKATAIAVSLGLDLYWALEELGLKLDDLGREHPSQDRRKALVELLQRGRDSGAKKGRGR